MDCSICRHDQDKRKEWGCDSDLEEVPDELRFACFYCHVDMLHGIGDRIDPNCHMCEGKGWWGPKRCPRTIVGNREGKVCETSVMLEYHLPSPGGWEDQAAKWRQAIAIVGRERARYEQETRAEDASKAKTGAR